MTLLKNTNRCPLCEEEFRPEFDNRKHLGDHEDVIRWRCQDCEEKITTYEDLTDHVCNTHLQHRFNVENTFSFLTRNMGDVSHINSTIGPFEIPLLESTSEHDVNCTSEVSENQEDDTTMNSRKRKLSNEPLKVSFIGRLCKENMIYNIPSKKRKKCNKW